MVNLGFLSQDIDSFDPVKVIHDLRLQGVFGQGFKRNVRSLQLLKNAVLSSG